MSRKTLPMIPSRSLLFAALICLLASAASAEWKEKVLYSFQGGTDGAEPIGGIVRDKVGNLYGANLNGGSSSCAGPGQCGTVYELSPPTQKGGSWTETILYVFKGYAFGDGATPEGGLIMDEAGNLYGTTGYGGTGPCVLLGPGGCGTVYELSPPANPGDPWTETVLYSFQGGNDGYVATGDLVFDKAGNLYGATLFGGGQGTTCDILYGGQCGTIFELSPPQTKGDQWTEKVLHSFAGGSDGSIPNGGLVLDRSGAVYGTTFYGGNESGSCNGGILGIGCGTVFKLSPPKNESEQWTEEMIHVFKDGLDGTQPWAGVILDSAGDIYGAAEGGARGCGVAFQIVPTGQGKWGGTALYNFGGDSYYYSPAVSGLDQSGNVYGITNVGPGSFGGSVFRLKRPADGESIWSETFLYDFTRGTDATFINPTLVTDSAGDIYGASQGGGGEGYCPSYCGTVFEIGP
jgi:hypothetical protein